MTNFADIQHLKNLTHCTTPQALQLLKQANNDVAQAEQLFHEQNLSFIQEQADCERELAEKFYRMCDFDVAKAIEKTQDWLFHARISQSVITTAEDKHYPYGACFIFTARGEK